MIHQRLRWLFPGTEDAPSLGFTAGHYTDGPGRTSIQSTSVHVLDPGTPLALHAEDVPQTVQGRGTDRPVSAGGHRPVVQEPPEGADDRSPDALPCVGRRRPTSLRWQGRPSQREGDGQQRSTTGCQAWTWKLPRRCPSVQVFGGKWRILDTPSAILSVVPRRIIECATRTDS